jgi:hypothetical protein
MEPRSAPTFNMGSKIDFPFDADGRTDGVRSADARSVAATKAASGLEKSPCRKSKGSGVEMSAIVL